MQITSFYVFHIRPKHQYNALVKMSYASIKLRKVTGCSFAKIMGSGAGPLGFGLRPNFKLYVAIMVWDNLESLRIFEKSNKMFLAYESISTKIDKYYGQPYKVHGLWGGINPFKIELNKEVLNSEIIVLTRARIRFNLIIKFWSFVPRTSNALLNVDGRKLSIGVGELPLLYQATMSIWNSQEHMRTYAYENAEHLEVIRKTKELNWYVEELFCRFYSLDIENLQAN